MEAITTTKKKGGRPKQMVTRTRTTGIRFSKSEHFVIREKAARAGLRLTSYIRQMAMEGQVKTRLTEEERGFVRQLIGLSNNMNQVAKACHDQGVLRAMQYFEQYRNQIDRIIQLLKT